MSSSGTAAPAAPPCGSDAISSGDVLGDGRRPDGRGFDARPQLGDREGPRHQGQRDDRHDRGGHEREQQLPVEAGADLAQQRAARGVRAPAHQREDARHERHQDVPERGQRQQFRQVDQVIERRDERVPERVDARPVVQDVGGVPAATALEPGPERAPGRGDLPEQRIVEGPGAVARGVDRAPSPAVDGEFQIASEQGVLFRVPRSRGRTRSRGSST